MPTSSTSPIGVFDSGVGGLTVVRALMERLPFENIIYFGDTARVPYGVKSVETIAHYTTQIAECLLEKDVKLLIIACNTMAAVAAQSVRDLSPVPLSVTDVFTSLSTGLIDTVYCTPLSAVALPALVVIAAGALIPLIAYTRCSPGKALSCCWEAWRSAGSPGPAPKRCS